MPTGTIVADDYIDDPDRTVSEMQAAMNQNLDYLRALKAEIDALSDTTIREAAVRAVGNLTGNVPDKAVLDARLGTTGNLDLSAYLTKSDFDPASPALVWSGSATKVPMSSLSEGGPGLYVVMDNSDVTAYMVFVVASDRSARGAHYINTSSTNVINVGYYATGSIFGEGFFLRSVKYDTTTGSDLSMSKIYKV